MLAFCGWTLWGLTRVPYEGNYMQKYAKGRYERLKMNMSAYESLQIKSQA